MSTKRPVDERAVAKHVAQMNAQEQAYRLREIRKDEERYENRSPNA
ncbi:hypothetical protein ACFSYH_07565 [Populibacterium corticicola]|uniref:Uncharacterized protein n=1 Tax=Populibacterium corticicola TaxID=1812826 RepID=A0ABW5XGM8_9MICO